MYSFVIDTVDFYHGFSLVYPSCFLDHLFYLKYILMSVAVQYSLHQGSYA
jgi:hypothetical protein